MLWALQPGVLLQRHGSCSRACCASNGGHGARRPGQQGSPRRPQRTPIDRGVCRAHGTATALPAAAPTALQQHSRLQGPRHCSSTPGCRSHGTATALPAAGPTALQQHSRLQGPRHCNSTPGCSAHGTATALPAAGSAAPAHANGPRTTPDDAPLSGPACKSTRGLQGMQPQQAPVSTQQAQGAAAGGGHDRQHAT